MNLRPLFILPLLLPGLCQADATLKYGSRAIPDGEIIIQVKDGDVLIGSLRSRVLIKNGQRKVTFIDDDSKTYMVMDEEAAKRMEQQMGAARQQMSAVMQQMQEQMKDMDEQQRAQLEQMMGGSMPSGAARKPVVTTVREQGRDKVDGVSCIELLVLVDGKPTGDVCVAKAGALGVAAKDYDAMVRATDTMRELMERMSGKDDSDVISMNLRAMKGIPVRMRDRVDGEITTLKSRSSAELDAKIFRVRDDYRLRKMLQ